VYESTGQVVNKNRWVQAVNRGYPCTPAPLFVIPLAPRVNGVKMNRGAEVTMKKGAGVQGYRGIG
jgi:hypothetical protein